MFNLNDIPHITVVGNCNMDIVVHLPKIPELGDRVAGTDSELQVGGDAIKTALAAHRLGIGSSVVARIGDDYFGSLAMSFMKQVGIGNEDTIATADFLDTGLALVMVTPGGERTKVVTPGANAALSPAVIDHAEKTIEQSQVIVVSLTIPDSAARRALEFARRYGTKTIIVPTSARHIEDDIFANSDFVIMSELEAKELLNLNKKKLISPDSALQLARLFMERVKCKGVIITLGEEGSVLVSQDYTEYAPSAPVEKVQDTIGAGDIFCGAFARYWLSTNDPRQALQWANAAATISVTRSGHFKYPTNAELSNFLSDKADIDPAVSKITGLSLERAAE